MNYEQEFLKQYREFSNPGSSYYQRGYQGILGALNASSPTISTLAGVSQMHGGSYKGSQVIAGEQRRAAETRNAGTARKGFLDMYMSGQGLAGQALAGAAQAYQYEDSKPSFWEEIGGYALGGLTQGLMGGGGFLSGLFGGGDNKLQEPNYNAGPQATNVSLSGNTNYQPQQQGFAGGLAQWGKNPNIPQYNRQLFGFGG